MKFTSYRDTFQIIKKRLSFALDMTEKNQPAVNYQWNPAWGSYPYYPMYPNVGWVQIKK